MPELDVSRLVNFSKQIDYTSLDWLSFLSDMVDKIPQLTPEWTDYTPSDQGMVVLELVSFILDALSYRCDVIANEAYIQTAVLRKAALQRFRHQAITQTSRLWHVIIVERLTFRVEYGDAHPAGGDISVHSFF